MASNYPDRLSVDEIESTVGSIKKMLKVGALFAVVGYLLIGAALFFELTQFHPLLENFFSTYTDTSLAGGLLRLGELTSTRLSPRSTRGLRR